MVAAVKGEIHNLLSVLRLNSRWASSERFVEEIPLHAESSLTRDLKGLHEYLQEKEGRGVDALAIVSPFVAVMQSSTTSGQMTGAALSSLHKFLLYGLVRRESVRAEEAINLIAEGIATCRFEETNRESDEVVLMKLLELTSVSLRCDAGPLITDARVAGMFDVCYRVSCHDRASELLRSSADNILAHMVLILFGSRLLLSTANRSSRHQDEANQPSETKLEDNEETDEAEEDESVLVLIMRLLSKLCDPRRNSESTCVLALSLVNIALESGGQRLGSHAGLVSTMQGDLCRNLLQNSQTDDLAILSLTLRVIFNLFNSIKDHMKVQLEVFLISVHLRFLNPSSGHSPEQRELVLESLLEFCREPVLMLDLFINYDCDVQCTNLFEVVCKTLATVATPKPGRPVNALNRLALEGVLAVVGSIARRCRTRRPRDDDVEHLHAALPSPSTPRPRPYRLSSDELSTTGGDVEHSLSEAGSEPNLLAATTESVDSLDATEWLAAARERTAQVLQQRRQMKKRLALAAGYFNTHSRSWLDEVRRLGLLGGSQDESPEPAAIAKFLHDAPSLDKNKVGEYLSKGPVDQYPVNAAVLRAYVSAFDLGKLTFDVALRTFLSGFRPPGESQCIERIMEAFATHLYDQWTAEDARRADASSSGGSARHISAGRVSKTTSPRDFSRSHSLSSSKSSHTVDVVDHADQPEELVVLEPKAEESPTGGLSSERPYSNPFKTSDAAFLLAFSTIILQTDLHNPAMKASNRMSVDDFVRNNRKINAGEDLPRHFLESVYEAIKQRPIHAPYELAPGAGNDAVELAAAPHDWMGLMSRKTAYVSRAAFTPASATKLFVAGVHECDMFQSIAEACIAAVLAVFANSVDAHLVLKTLDGFADYAQICVYFELEKPLNQLLLDFISDVKAFLNEPGNHYHHEDAAVGQPTSVLPRDSDGKPFAEADVNRQPRPLLALEMALVLLRTHGDTVSRDAWAHVIDLLLDLADRRALPKHLVEIDDVDHDDGAKLGPSLFASRCNAHWIFYYAHDANRMASLGGRGADGRSSRRSGSSLGWISSFLWGASEHVDEGNTKPSVEAVRQTDADDETAKQLVQLEGDSSMRAAALRAVLRTGGASFFEHSQELSLTSASALLGALTALADPSGEIHEARASLALEHAWCVIKANASRAVALWPSLHTVLAATLGSQSTVCRLPYLAERCAIIALRAAAHLDEPGSRRSVSRSLHLLASLDNGVVAHIADRLALGVADVVRRSTHGLDDEDLFDALLRILEIADKHDSGMPHVAAALVAIVDAARATHHAFQTAWTKSKSLVFANLDRQFPSPTSQQHRHSSAPAAAGKRSTKSSSRQKPDDAALVTSVCGVQRLLVSLLDHHDNNELDLRPDILHVFNLLERVRAPTDKAAENAVAEIVNNTSRLLLQRGLLPFSQNEPPRPSAAVAQPTDNQTSQQKAASPASEPGPVVTTTTRLPHSPTRPLPGHHVDPKLQVV